MRRLWHLLMIALSLALLPGCGNSKDKDVNRHKDLPRAAPTENNK